MSWQHCYHNCEMMVGSHNFPDIDRTMIHYDSECSDGYEHLMKKRRINFGLILPSHDTNSINMDGDGLATVDNVSFSDDDGADTDHGIILEDALDNGNDIKISDEVGSETINTPDDVSCSSYKGSDTNHGITFASSHSGIEDSSHGGIENTIGGDSGVKISDGFGVSGIDDTTDDVSCSNNNGLDTNNGLLC